MHTIIDKKSEKASFFGNLLGGTLSLSVSAIIVKIIGLIYKIPISSILGDEGMGYFNSAYTVFGFFYLLCTAGVPKAVMILVAEGDDEKRGRAVLNTAMRAFLLVGAALSSLFLVFAAPIARLIGNREAFFSMLSIAPSLVFVALSGVLRGYLTSRSALWDIAVSQLIEGVGKLVFGLALAYVGLKLEMSANMLSAMTVFGVTLGSGFGFAYLFGCEKIKNKKENVGQNKINKPKEENDGSRQIIRKLLKISLPITLSAAVMSASNIIDLGIIMRGLLAAGHSEGEASSLYGNYTTLAVPMLNLAMSIITPISVAYMPILARMHFSGKGGTSRSVEKDFSSIISAVAAPVAIGLFVYSHEILEMLFKNSQIEIGAALLRLLSPAIVFSSLLLSINTSLEACGRVKAPLISMSVGCALKLFVSSYLIQGTDMGILGAPIGTVTMYAVALFVSLVLYGKATGSVSPVFEGAFTSYFGAFLSVTLSRIGYNRLIFALPSTPALLLSIALAALIYLAFSALFGILRPRKIVELAKYTKLSS